ncbi:uncharacterized protein LOC117180558 [Belonocnema kinseyi]|uniref:uncharacterized protein LOC117180558 n=1 Tax=Belonocnema kinseyi TaxID=2817044 RepID=UPI00143D792A|nr:uncharacterized protein LOC117180558 [Belonocnema kinseyi]
MQLRFIRFYLIISLLTSNEAKLKPKSKNISFENKEMNFESSKAFQNLRSLKNNYPKSRLGRTSYVKAILSNPELSPKEKMTKKLARGALNSPKKQKEFRKLTLIKSRKRNSHEIMKNSKRKEDVFRSIKATKGYYKPVFKDPKRNKRKRHKCGFGLGWCSDSDSSKHDSFKKVPYKIREKAVCKRGARNLFLELNKTRNPGKAVRESMLEKVMKTTTKNPNKKNPGDQGMEYSEYYNEDDELEDFDDEAELAQNESGVFLNDLDQNRSHNQVNQQNKHRQSNQRNQIQQNIN